MREILVETTPESVKRLVLVVLRFPEREAILVLAVERSPESVLTSLISAEDHENVEVAMIPESVAICPLIAKRVPESAFCARRSVK